jgi:heme exporter protein A
VLEGKLLWVKGENGAGKSTLLKTLLGFIKPLAGEITWQDKKPEIFYLSHELGLQRQLTVLEYCAWHPAVIQPSQESIQQALKSVNLLPQAYQLTGHLSRGQQQRLLFACGLLSKAKLWILDEPLTALDATSHQSILQCLSQHQSQGGAAIVVSHYPLEAIADEVIHVE